MPPALERTPVFVFLSGTHYETLENGSNKFCLANNGFLMRRSRMILTYFFVLLIMDFLSSINNIGIDSHWFFDELFRFGTKAQKMRGVYTAAL